MPASITLLVVMNVALMAVFAVMLLSDYYPTLGIWRDMAVLAWTKRRAKKAAKRRAAASKAQNPDPPAGLELGSITTAKRGGGTSDDASGDATRRLTPADLSKGAGVGFASGTGVSIPNPMLTVKQR